MTNWSKHQSWIKRIGRSSVKAGVKKRYLYVTDVAQAIKSLSAMQETWVRFLGWKDPLEKEMATHSSTLAWKIHGWRKKIVPWKFHITTHKTHFIVIIKQILLLALLQTAMEDSLRSWCLKQVSKDEWNEHRKIQAKWTEWKVSKARHIFRCREMYRIRSCWIINTPMEEVEGGLLSINSIMESVSCHKKNLDFTSYIRKEKCF